MSSSVLIRLLSCNAKALTSASSCVGKRFASLSTRPFSSQPVVNNAATELIVNPNKTPWAISYFGKTSVVPSIRPFSSKPSSTTNDVVTDVKVSSSDQTGMSTMKLVAYKIVKAPNGEVRVEGNGQQYSLNEIGPFIFKKMKEKAESYVMKGVCSKGEKKAEYHLREKLSKTMVVVPVYFSDAQRQAIKDAATVAGLDVTKIVDEKTTSELSYELNKECGDAIAVFDLSGGNFDLSIKLILNCYGVVQEADDTFEELLLEYFLGEFKSSHGIDLIKDQLAYKRVQKIIGKAKLLLAAEL